jgi:ergosteryl-3beta-O-L-aspartate synthase
MLDADNSQVTNSFHIFLRGQEIVTGGQRIHDAHTLESRMNELGVSTNGMEEYLDAFEYGAPPHAGCGIGLERLVMLLLNLGNIRFASLFPRDPKSLPERSLQLELRHPEASTCPPPWKHKGHHGRLSGGQHRDYQPLEKLIANYGDASNTSWLDERYQVWRHEVTGAAIGYVPSKHDRLAIIVGNPLCDPRQYSYVTSEFIHWLLVKDNTNLKPIWILVDNRVEEVLGGRLGWSSLTCAAEERVNNPVEYNGDVQRKIRHAKAEGLSVAEVEPTQDLRCKCDEGIKEWLSNRKHSNPSHEYQSVARHRASSLFCRSRYVIT